jgi:hypothetical protein
VSGAEQRTSVNKSRTPWATRLPFEKRLPLEKRLLMEERVPWDAA